MMICEAFTSLSVMGTSADAYGKWDACICAARHSCICMHRIAHARMECEANRTGSVLERRLSLWVY